MKIQTAINITFEQSEIEELIRKAILAEHPNLELDEIKFNVRRNPQTIDVEVNAQLAGMTSSEPVKTKQLELPIETEKEDEEVVMPKETIPFDVSDPIEVPAQEEEVPPPSTTLADLFNEHSK